MSVLRTCDTCERVWSSCRERYAACNIVRHDQIGGGSGMVWGGISMGGHTDVYRLGNGTCLISGIGTTDWLHHCFTFICVVSLNSALSRLIIFIPIFSFLKHSPVHISIQHGFPPTETSMCSKCS